MTSRHTPLSVIALAAALLVSTGRSAAQSFNFVSIDVPCSACTGGIARSTVAQGINPGGDIVGVFRDAANLQHGFLLSGGVFTSIDVPGALVEATGTLPTVARGISPSGDIVGNFVAPVSSAPEDSPAYCPKAGSPACIKGFLYSRGKFSIVLAPGHPGAIPQRITPNGDIYGCLHDFDLMRSMYGFARTRSGYISLMAGGGELADRNASFPISMNNGATPDGHAIVGLWTDVDGKSHGYVVQDGAFHSYDVPASVATNTWDVNPSGAFVGVYVDTGRNQHGFLQPPDGSPAVAIDVPTTAPFNSNGKSTAALGINPGGAIVGQYTDTSLHVHGFLAAPAEE